MISVGNDSALKSVINTNLNIKTAAGCTIEYNLNSMVNGINISSHASRHLPNGSDPLTTGAPSNVGTSNQEGIANAFARQDHQHALGTDVVSDSNIQSHTSSKITIVNK